MDGRDDFADWSSYREPRGGRDDRGSRDERRGSDQYGYDFDLEGEARVPAPRSGDARYASLAELSERGAERGTERGADRAPERGAERPRGRDREREWDRGGDRFPVPVDPDFAPRGARSGEPLPPPPGPMPAAPMGAPMGGPMPGSPMGGQTYPDPEPLRQRTETVDAAAVRRSVAESDGVYRSKRPALAVAFGVFAGLGGLLMLRSLLTGLSHVEPGRALAPLLALVAFPLLGLGLYALTTGAATAVQFQGPRVWLRTPLVYLVVGAALMLAAASAA
ncbi:hypothetical protein QEZ54_00635 [Catellatospora sp. KI3]|uniref:hypothetical protein n=1 Tax=Catellatospora sp. KI3 TaxID=3041620 RepID=UPI0024823D76|nr:hypothetical protein [Catellatospora sp. KI3]MDI1459464.1 hypothetical protein [Catellatospora sp. KI3]